MASVTPAASASPPSPRATGARGGPGGGPLGWQVLNGRARRGNPLLLALSRTLRNPMGIFGLAVIAVLVVVAALAPVLAPFSPIEHHAGDELAVPALPYLLGTDEFGRDILSRIIWGSRISLLVGVVAVALGATVGITSGLLAGYLGGWLETVIMRGYDAVLAFPAILLGIAVVTVLGPGPLNVAYAIAIAQMPIFARITRSCVLSEREREYVQAARCLGGTSGRIMRLHILPNCLGPLLVQLSLAMSFAVLAEAGLAFLGLGTQPPDPSLGGMLNDARAYLRVAPWYGVWPGVALATLLVGLTYLSDALRDALDPRLVNAA